MKKNTKKNNKRVVSNKRGQTKKIKKIKIRFGRIFLTLLILCVIIYLIVSYVNFPIKNIFIEGNNKLSDQEIIDISKLNNYPSYFKYTEHDIKKNLEKNDYIKKANVKKKNLSEVYIKIDENYVIFYNMVNEKTVLSDGVEIKKKLNGPILVNYVPDKVYLKLIKSLNNVKINILDRISEIKYEPSNVDEERFLFTMTDGNYVYITLEKIESINNYLEISLEIINKYGNKNGTLNLDVGQFFEIFDD